MSWLTGLVHLQKKTVEMKINVLSAVWTSNDCLLWQVLSLLLIICIYCQQPSQLNWEDYKMLQDKKLQIKFVQSIPFIIAGSNTWQSKLLVTPILTFSACLSFLFCFILKNRTVYLWRYTKFQNQCNIQCRGNFRFQSCFKNTGYDQPVSTLRSETWNHNLS